MQGDVQEKGHFGMCPDRRVLSVDIMKRKTYLIVFENADRKALRSSQPLLMSSLHDKMHPAERRCSRGANRRPFSSSRVLSWSEKGSGASAIRQSCACKIELLVLTRRARYMGLRSRSRCGDVAVCFAHACNMLPHARLKLTRTH